MRTVAASRYITPLREGGSLPAIVEADDDGLYVLKFRGAGQGAKALVAELVAGELARAAGLPVPEIVLVTLDPDLARTEPDAEIQDLIRASAGLNIGIDFLPGALAFDPAVENVEPALASRIVWFDVFASNVDRTARNPNLLVWHRRLWLIDHGAALYFHHVWPEGGDRSGDSFAGVREHVLLPFASCLDEADEAMATTLDAAMIDAVVDLVPAAWLDGGERQRDRYRQHLKARVATPRAFAEEALRARSADV